jgi:acetyl esterase/lipase
VDDEIDKLNSDVQAMLVIYAGGQVNPENKNYPAVFLAFGTQDFLLDSATQYYKDLKAHNIFAEIHGFAGAPHGFGAGTGIPDYAGTNPVGFGASAASPGMSLATLAGPGKPYLLAYTGAQQWPKLADTFLDQVFKYKPVSY